MLPFTHCFTRVTKPHCSNTSAKTIFMWCFHYTGFEKMCCILYFIFTHARTHARRRRRKQQHQQQQQISSAARSSWNWTVLYSCWYMWISFQVILWTWTRRDETTASGLYAVRQSSRWRETYAEMDSLYKCTGVELITLHRPQNNLIQLWPVYIHQASPRSNTGENNLTIQPFSVDPPPPDQIQ
jgi:hypothetical protein